MATTGLVEVEKSVGDVNVDETFPIVVDYDESIENIAGDESYSWVNRNIISRNFPAPKHGKHEVEIEFICFERETSTKKAIEQIEHQGLRPIDVYELFHLIDKYPGIPFSVVALGSMLKDPDSKDYLIPYFCRSDSKRSRMRLGHHNINWNNDHRFAVVHK
ncbi:MAG: hypothetical protein AAB890_01430 [Patescibacteria group bacterium]